MKSTRALWALIVAGAMVADGASGQSLRFFGNQSNDIDRVKIRIDDGTSASETVPRPADVGATDFTIEFWIKGALAANGGAVSCSGYNWIFGNVVIDRDRFGQGRAYGISLGSGRVAFGVINASNATATVCSESGVSVLDGTWHHVAVQRNVSSGQLTVHIDGLQRGQAPGPAGDISYPDNGVPGGSCSGGACVNSDPFLVLGAEKHDAGGTLAFDGFLDEVRLSTALRYPANFTQPSEPFIPDSDTAALYHFDDENTGTTVNDADSADGNTSPGALSVGGTPAGPIWSPETPFAPSAGTVELSSATFPVDEDVGVATITAVRSGGSTGAASVVFSTSDGSAFAPGDYAAMNSTINWNDGQGGVQSFSVAVVNDSVFETSETVNLTLSNPMGATLGQRSTAILTIADDETSPGSLRFTAGAFTRAEAAGATNLTVSRASGSAGAVTVDYAATDGTAGSGDYALAAGTLSWGSGDVTNQSIPLTIQQDALIEGSEQFTVALSSPSGGASLGTPGTATVTITDDEAPPSPPPPPGGSGGGSGRLDLALILALIAFGAYRRTRTKMRRRPATVQ